MNSDRVIDELAIVPYVSLLLTPITLVLGWPVVAIFLSGVSLLTTMFCLGGFVLLPMLIIHLGGLACGVVGLMSAGGG